MLTQKLRHRITIQNRTTVQDTTTGEETTVWADLLANEPAEVVAQSAREFNASQATQAETRGRITIRKPTVSINTTMRVVWNGNAYQLEGVLPDPSDARWLTLIYSQGVNDGQ